MIDNKYRKPLIIVAILAIIAVVICAIILILNAAKTASLLVYVTPIDATVTIDGQDYPNGVYDFYPSDTVTATISRDGFESKTVTIRLESGKVTNLFVYLTGANNDFSDYYTNASDLTVLRQVGTDDLAQDFLNSYDEGLARSKEITEILPIYGYTDEDIAVYIDTITDDSDCEDTTKLCLIISDPTNDNYDAGIKAIEEAGFNPKYYNIVYQGFSGSNIND